MDLTAMYQRLEAFFREYRSSALPQATADHARYIVLDTFGALLRGYADEAVRNLALGASQLPASCTVYTAPYPKVAPTTAIISNAASIASTELSEGNRDAKGHMAIQVFPGVLASAEEFGSTTSQVLRAFVLGYEISARMASASKRHFRAYGHGIYAPAATAVAVGELQGLEANEIVNLLQIAGNLSQAPAFVTHFEGATVRNLTAGIGGAIGAMVPTFHRAGFEGSRAAMEVTLGENLGSHFSRSAFAQDLGARYMSDRNYFKTFASGRHMHAATEALAEIIENHGLEFSDILSVEVRTYFPATTMVDVMPRNALAAKTSIPFCLAAYAVLGHNLAEAFEGDALTDPRVLKLARAIHVTEDEGRTARGGWGADTTSPQRSAYVEIKTVDGRVLGAECRQTKGDYDMPVTRSELEAKFLHNATYSLGRARAEALKDTILHANESAPFVESVRAILTA